MCGLGWVEAADAVVEGGSAGRGVVFVCHFG